MNVGIVGQGFVGSAIREGLTDFHTMHTYDLRPEIRNCETLKELVEKSKIIFACVPTPMRKDGRCDTRLISKVVYDINQAAATTETGTQRKKIVVVKSTVPPGTTDRLDRACLYVDVMFSPEFLTEANSFNDFKNQTRIILGGPRPATSTVKMMFRKAFPEVPIIKTGSRTAETVKYFTNCFLSTKVSFANEMKQICDGLGIDYDKVVEYTLHDTRLGKTHWSVPGPDGHLGFGGHCFPKDLRAMISIANDLGISPSILMSVWEKNDEVRETKDWEEMKGRAISED